jgi:hypothetical protein
MFSGQVAHNNSYYYSSDVARLLKPPLTTVPEVLRSVIAKILVQLHKAGLARDPAVSGILVATFFSLQHFYNTHSIFYR